MVTRKSSYYRQFKQYNENQRDISSLRHIQRKSQNELTNEMKEFIAKDETLLSLLKAQSTKKILKTDSRVKSSFIVNPSDNSS